MANKVEKIPIFLLSVELTCSDVLYNTMNPEYVYVAAKSFGHAFRVAKKTAEILAKTANKASSEDKSSRHYTGRVIEVKHFCDAHMSM